MMPCESHSRCSLNSEKLSPDSSPGGATANVELVVAAAAATTSSTLAVAPPGELSGDSFSLFSEHLLCDSHGIIDVGLLTDDQPAWTPSRLDDKVTELDFTLCFSINSTPSGRKRNQFSVCSLF